MSTTYTLPGRYWRYWPATLGPFTLMGPANCLGAWRWYQRSIVIGGRQITERIKVDSPCLPTRLGVPLLLRDGANLLQVETTYSPLLREPWEDNSDA